MRSLQYRPLREPSDTKKEEPTAAVVEEAPADNQVPTDAFDESVTIS